MDKPGKLGQIGRVKKHLPLFLLLSLAGCPQDFCGGPDVARAPMATAQAGQTSLSYFDGFLVQGAAGVAGASLRGEDDCSPIAVALRPFEDDGSTYHRPQRPGEDLEWLKGARPVVTAAADGSVATVPLVNGDGEAQGLATLEMRPGREGFVEVDITLPFRDEIVALVTTCWQLADDEHVVGGGERFDGVDLRGRTIPLAFNLGGYTSGTNEAHAPVPFLATSRGLALYFETERPGAFDVGDSQPGALIARFHGNHLKMHVRADGITENVAAHARHVGLPPMPPRWVLAPQQWRNEHSVTVENDVVVTTGKDELLFDIDYMRANGIPTTAVWIDAPWTTGHNTFEFNEVQFPEPDAMLAELDDKGFRPIVWATEHVNSSDDQDQMYGMPEHGSLALFNEFEDNGWLVKNRNNDNAWEFPWGRGLGGYVDFTHPDAVAAWQDLMRPLLERGIRGFKLDYGEAMRPELLGLTNDAVRFSDGSTNDVMHTRYARLYHEAFLEVLREVHPDDWYVITRTGGIYDQENGVTLWPGDLDNDWLPAGAPDPDDGDGAAVGGLPAAVQGGLSLAMSGYPLYGSDIGGYRGGTPTYEVLMRWAQYGAVSTVMQLGGAGSHNPWDADHFPPEAVGIYRRYARLHMDLLPTWEELLRRATTDGTPPLVPVGVYMTDDEEAWADEHTFVIGRTLLAAPVVEEGATERTLRVPAGTWVGWWDGERHEGPATITVDAPLDTLPLFQRAGVPLLLGHPELDTAVDADDATVRDYAELGDVRIARVAAGPGSAAVAGDLAVTTAQDGGAFTVDVTGEETRRVAIDFRTPEGESVAVSASGAAATEVADEAALWECTTRCVLREADRVLVFFPSGDRGEVTFGP